MLYETAFDAKDSLKAYLSAPVGVILEVLPYVYFGAQFVAAGDGMGEVLRKAGFPLLKEDVRNPEGDVVGTDWTYSAAPRQSVIVRMTDEVVTFVAKRAEP